MLQYVSALSDKRQQWQEPTHLYQRELRPAESVSLEHSGEQRRNEAEEADEEGGILEYDSSSSEVVDDESLESLSKSLRVVLLRLPLLRRSGESTSPRSAKF